MKILFVQDYIPAYRSEFFSRLKLSLEVFGIQVVVAVGEPKKSQRNRLDDSRTYDIKMKQVEFTLLGKTFIHRKLPRLNEFDLVIFEQAIRNLDLWTALAASRLKIGARRIALWGHGKSYSKRSKFETTLMRWLTLQADYFFVYTEAGESFLRSLGMPSNRICFVGNSVFTPKLNLNHQEKQPEVVTGAFVGGIDSRKGVSVFPVALKKLGETIQGLDFHFVGAGDLRDELEDFFGNTSRVYFHGHLYGKEKAELLSRVQFFVIPKSVGLVAVEALAYRVPIFTMELENHGPEFDYLTLGETVFVCPNVDLLVDAITNYLGDEIQVRKTRRSAELTHQRYGFDSFVERFTQGILDVLQFKN